MTDVESLRAYPPVARRRSLGRRVRMVTRALRWRLTLALIRAAFIVGKSGGRTYQPVEIAGRRYANVRDSDERWQAIAATLRAYDARNVLDIGCAEGWFVRRAAADLGCFAIGVEATDTVIVGELARLHDRAERSALVRAFVTPAVIGALPKFDAVLCTSVLHHVIRAFGLASAEQFLRALSGRVGKVLIFEIGTAGESSWSKALPFELGEQQENFVRRLLETSGFRNVRVIAESLAYHREAKRFLFAAEPAERAEPDIDPLVSASA